MYFLSTVSNLVWMYRLLFVCVCVCVCVCVGTITDFSAEDRASGVKFFSAVHRRPRHGISNFCELCFHRSHWRARGLRLTVHMHRRKRHARYAPFVKSRCVWTYDRHVWIGQSHWRTCIFCKALLGVAYLRCWKYVRNPTAALTTHTLPIYYSYLYLVHLKPNLTIKLKISSVVLISIRTISLELTYTRYLVSE